MSVDKSPVYEVKAVPVEKVYANDYNPNVVAPPEMKLLELSIWEDGFTMPCVCYYNKDEDRYILVDYTAVRLRSRYLPVKAGKPLNRKLLIMLLPCCWLSA